MPDISKITLPSGTTYNIKDSQARTDIATIKATVTGSVSFVGNTATDLTDGAKTTPITIGGKDYTPANGNIVISGQKQFVWADFDSAWHEFGSTGSLKGLAFKSSATGSLTPSGTVSKPSFTGSAGTASATRQ